MTQRPDDDAARLTELGRGLAAPDLDPARAARIAWSARQDFGRRPSLVRFVEPVVIAALVASYLVWAIVRMLEAWR
jgi:hypothetical protein